MLDLVDKVLQAAGLLLLNLLFSKKPRILALLAKERVLGDTLKHCLKKKWYISETAVFTKTVIQSAESDGFLKFQMF